MKASFLRVLRDGSETGSYTIPFGSEIRFELGIFDAGQVRFYLGNDEKVLLQKEAPFLCEEDSLRVFACTVKTEEIAPEGDGLFFFHFEAETSGGRRYTVCEENRLAFSDHFVNEFQLTVYRSAYPSPDWLDNGVFYQVFVDRFYKSGRSPRRPDAVYCEDWTNGIPEYPAVAGQPYPNNTHFGGDLYGVAEKLDYLKDLGITVLYLSPVASAFSNHKYDTGDYLQVDPSFGGDAALAFLLQQAHARGMHVILDGVFNHVGDDSVYFNRYGKYPSAGAYQSKESPYFPWFHFRSYPNDYECWWGIKNLPKTVKCESYRSFICKQVIPKYLRMGADGFRLDVVDELESEFLEEIVAAIKAEKPDAAVIGEVWEDASNKIAYDERKRYFRGKQLDGVMNYPLRNGMIAFLREGDASILRAVTETLYCHYPPKALAHTMNSIGTHDTERILTVLGGEPDTGEENAVLAVRRMTPEQRKRAMDLLRCGYALLASLPGVPCIYYGDEAGLEGYHDPFNRLPFPWGRIDPTLYDSFRSVNRCRAQEPLLSAEGFSVLESPPETFVFCRYAGDEKLTVISNRSNREVKWVFDTETVDLFTNDATIGEVLIPPVTTKWYKGRSD